MIRELLVETKLSKSELIFPLFMVEGDNIKQEVPSMPGIYRFSVDNLMEEINECVGLGIKTFCLFPAFPESKKDKIPTLTAEH